MTAERRRGAALLTLSLGLHTLALGAIFTVLPSVPASPLLIDLSEMDGPPGAAGPAANPALAADPARPRVPASHRGETRPEGPSRQSRAQVATATPPPLMAAAPAPAMPEPPATTGDPPPSPTPAPPVTPPAATMLAPSPAPGAASAGSASGAAPAGAASAAEPETSGSTLAGARGSTGQASDLGGLAGGAGSHLALARPGSGRGGVPPEYGPYLASFRQRVEAALVYPLAARRLGRTGRVELEVLLEPSGLVRRVDVAQSSASPALDAAALDAVRAVAPIPFPEGLPRRPLLLRVPLVFELR